MEKDNLEGKTTKLFYKTKDKIKITLYGASALGATSYAIANIINNPEDPKSYAIAGLSLVFDVIAAYRIRKLADNRYFYVRGEEYKMNYPLIRKREADFEKSQKHIENLHIG